MWLTAQPDLSLCFNMNLANTGQGGSYLYKECHHAALVAALGQFAHI
jgi:hypothetical protein